MVVRCAKELPAAIIGIFRRRSDREQNRVLTRSHMVANDCCKRVAPITHRTHAGIPPEGVLAPVPEVCADLGIDAVYSGALTSMSR